MGNYSKYLSIVKEKDTVNEEKVLANFVYEKDPSIDAKNITRKKVPGFPYAEIWDDVFSEDECKAIISSLEKSGEFSFWNPGNSAKKTYRNVDTIEGNMRVLSKFIWERVKNIFTFHEFEITENDSYSEEDNIGKWKSIGIYEKMFFGRYSDGGHFGPHTDCSVCIDTNTRTLWTVLLYLNTIPEEGGGATSFVDESQKTQKRFVDEFGRERTNPNNVITKVQPKAGRMVIFFIADMHEGEPLCSGYTKYILRTDILYKRVDPILTSEADQKAYVLWLKGKDLTYRGNLDEAKEIFRKVSEISPELATKFNCLC
ncbi:prolyl 4-hydroxylase alpha subunit [Cryptosporidium sp. chipmunk genotype I]|uniref:prolyl 4-hydroxylase alpha subunit n=1 Tax=Cryptosporidium sp. chipmunk genotype I TaxID=1280935 RepID=UPI003519FD3F|nr:prolyl 4-hydroxylase alpha subunit [Cryptosporidium sp. chipmunk genotype I]